MKRITFTLVVLFATVAVTAQTKFWVCKSNGTYVEYIISETDSITFTDPFAPTPILEKCKASDYAQVTIGTQTWMAENYRCSKYDTESEAYNASWLTNNTIPTSNDELYPPYYTDASDKSKWNTEYGHYYGNLTDAQVAKLGYLYNWAAAVGVEYSWKYTTEFSSNRQGICPNGWHVPTNAEWQTLQDYIGETQGKESYTAGKHLKTMSGWYDDGEPALYPQGLDTYGFAALPAGYSDAGSVNRVGVDANFWTATPYYEGSKYNAYGRVLYNDSDYMGNNNCTKYYGRSVRCLRN